MKEIILEQLNTLNQNQLNELIERLQEIATYTDLITVIRMDESS